MASKSKSTASSSGAKEKSTSSTKSFKQKSTTGSKTGPKGDFKSSTGKK